MVEMSNSIVNIRWSDVFDGETCQQAGDSFARGTKIAKIQDQLHDKNWWMSAGLIENEFNLVRSENHLKVPQLWPTKPLCTHYDDGGDLSVRFKKRYTKQKIS